MCGPARMRDANRPVNRAYVHEALEHRDLALGFSHLEAVAVAHRNAGGVVPAVFESLEPFDEQRRRALRSNVSNDSTHGVGPSSGVTRRVHRAARGSVLQARAHPYCWALRLLLARLVPSRRGGHVPNDRATI